MNLSIPNMFIFGDIEGNMEIYNNTLECIKRNWDTSRFMFLGDIYSARNVNDSINIIKSLSSYFWDNEEVITKHSDPIEVLRLFQTLWKDKDMKCINSKYRQFWRHVPKASKLSTTLNKRNHFNYDRVTGNITDNLSGNSKDSNSTMHFKYKFLFGNKEIEFLSDIISSKNITKFTTNTHGTQTTYFNIPITYFNNNTKLEETTVNVYSYSQLNVMYNYLAHCEHYHVENNILYTHCYFNCNMIEGINKVVAGHNKGYGKFSDVKYNGMEIYLIDLTSNWNGKNNYMLYTNKSFIHYNDEYFPDGLNTLKRSV